MKSMKKQPLRRRPMLETLEDRTLLSGPGSGTPLSQLISQGLFTGPSADPLALTNLFSPNAKHPNTGVGTPPAGTVGTDFAGRPVFALPNQYLVQLQMPGLSAAAAADPKQLLRHAQGELTLAKLANPDDRLLGSLKVTQFLGLNIYLVTTTDINASLNDSPSLQPEFAKITGFKNAAPDVVFPAQDPPARHKLGGPPGPHIAEPPSSPFPPLTEVGLAGDLIFSGSADAFIGSPATTVSYTLSLNAGQTLAVIDTPDSGLQVQVSISGPGGPLGSATGSGPGALTAVQAVTAPTSGTYTIMVKSAGGTTGDSTVQAIVNASLQKERYLGGPEDNSAGAAQSLDTPALDLGNGAMRSAVIGTSPLQAGPGDAFVSVPGVGIQLVSSAGGVQGTLSDPALSSGSITGIRLGATGKIFVGLDGGEILCFSPAGTLQTTIILPSDTLGFQFYPDGFAVAADGSLWVGQANSGNVIHTDAAGNLLRSYAVGGTPSWLTLRSDGQVFVSNRNGGLIQQLDPTSGAVATFATDPAGLPFGLSFTAGGDLVVADPNTGLLRFNAAGALTQTIADVNAPEDVEPDPSGNLLVADFGFFNGPFLEKFDPTGTTLLASTPLAGSASGLAVAGTEDVVAPADTTDYYSVTLTAGQTVTVVLSDLQGGGTAHVALLDPSSNLLAFGKPVAGSEIIDSLPAATAGTYLVRVTANDVQYGLTVEKGADLDAGGHNAISSAQPLYPSAGGAETVVGNLSMVSLFGVDWQNAPQQLIHGINTQTGAFQSTIQGPVTSVTNPYGFNMAFDGTNLWFNDGASSGSNTIFKLDPGSGAVLASFASPTPELFGLAWLNGFLYGTDDKLIYKLDPNTGALLGQFNPGLDGNATGLAGDPTRNVLWAVSQNHTLFEIDPVGQTVIKSGPDGLSLNEQDIGFNNNELYVSETTGPGSNDVAVFDPATLSLKRRLPVATPTFISGLAADGFTYTGVANYYQVSLKANAGVMISTTTPNGTAGSPFQPFNSLDPAIDLYDPQGNLVATNDNGAPDHKNAQLVYIVPTGATGKYTVRVRGAGGTTGDYTLTVQGATGNPPGFKALDTNPPTGAHVRPFSTITVDFGDTVLAPSVGPAVAAGKVTFGGKPVTSYTVVNDHQVSFVVQPAADGDDVPTTFAIAAGAIQNIHGVAAAAFSDTIFWDTVAPHVVSTSIPEGTVLTKTGKLTYKVTFSEPMDQSFASFNLHGVYQNIYYSPASVSFNKAGTILTVQFSGLPDDAYQMTLIGVGFFDVTGYNLPADFVNNFILDDKTLAFPATFQRVNPVGSEIYQATATNAIAPAGESETSTLNLVKGQTATIYVTTDGNLQANVALYAPNGNLIDSSTAAATGGSVLLQTEPLTATGKYKLVITGANNTPGLYHAQVTLNAAVESETHGGTSNDSPATAQPLDNSFIVLAGTATRAAVLGNNSQFFPNLGDVLVSERGGPGVVLVANADGIAGQINDPVFSGGVVSGIRLGADGSIYVALDVAAASGPSGNGGEILHYSANGSTLLATIKLPNDASGGLYYPFGFALAQDGSFWVPQPNGGNVAHLSAAGGLIQSYHVGGDPEWTAVRADGQVFYSDDLTNQVNQLDPTSGHVIPFVTGLGLPFGLAFTQPGGHGNLLVSDAFNGVFEYDASANLLLSLPVIGNNAETDLAGNIFAIDDNLYQLDKFDSAGNLLTTTTLPGAPIGLAVVGVDGGASSLAPDLTDYYSFHLDLGQSATVALTQLGGTGTVHEALVDAAGNILVPGSAVGTNIGETLSYVAPAAGTYYLKVTGNQVQYSVVVTRNAAFDTEANDSRATAQPLPAANTALGAVFVPHPAQVGSRLEGLSFSDSNCGCVPPDTVNAVGPTQVAEATNTAFRVYDKATGAVLQTIEIGTLFNIPMSVNLTDPYLMYDDIAQRWVLQIISFNSPVENDLYFGVSKSSNLLDGFIVNKINFGTSFLDFEKVGFNADAYVVTGNLFDSNGNNTGLDVIAIDKAQLLAPAHNFVTYQTLRDATHFRAEVAAEMHGSNPGDPMYLVEEAGYDNGHAARVVTMTNVLSPTPTFVDTDLTVNPYDFPAPAGQPGASYSVATNDTTFTRADWRNGLLVSAQSVGEADDGFNTARVRWYEFSTSGAQPALVQQGTINPGPGVSTYYGTAALDVAGNIGITYMESSATEFVSMYVAVRRADDPVAGRLSVGTLVAAGTATDYNLYRAGDYGGIGVDPTDGMTFWASNEYVGTDAVYNTFVASFTVARQDEDWYSFGATAGNKLTVAVTMPGSSTGALFPNGLSPVVELYNASGTKVAMGTTSLSYTVPGGQTGAYYVRVLGGAGSQGEYVVSVTGATAPILAAASGGSLAAVGSGHGAPIQGAGMGQAARLLLASSPATGLERGQKTVAAPDHSTTVGTASTGVVGVVLGGSVDAAFASLAGSDSGLDDMINALAGQLVAGPGNAPLLFEHGTRGRAR